MLTSFFGKSSPLNFLLVIAYVVVVSIIWFVSIHNGAINIAAIGWLSLNLLLVIVSVFILDFVVKKNALSAVNSYAIFFYGCFLATFPTWTMELPISVASLCLLFAMRRMFSLQSFKNAEIKILDATLWIALASLFYFPSIWMLLILYMAIYFKPLGAMRYFLIPFAGLFAAAMLTLVYYVFDPASVLKLGAAWNESFVDFVSYSLPRNIVAITFLAAIVVWAVIYRAGKFTAIARKDKPNYIITSAIWLVALVMVLFSSEKSTAEFLLVFPSAAIVLASFMEQTSEKWFKELVLWMCLLLPIGLFFV